LRLRGEGGGRGGRGELREAEKGRLGLLSGAPSDERDDERVREAEDAAGEAGGRSDDVERSLVRLVAVGVHLAAVRLVRRVEAARAVLGGGRSLEVLEVLRVHEVVGVGVPEARGKIGGERGLEVNLAW